MPSSGVAQRRGRAAPAVHDETVEGEGERLHAVDVGRQRERRLRLADGQDALGLEIAEGAVVVAAQRPADLGVDVVRERIAGVGERAVPRRVEGLEPLAGEVVRGAADRHEHVAALDPDALRRHAHPRVSAAEQLVGHVREVGRRVDPGAHVQPLDHDGAVEVGRLGGTAHHDAGPVVGRRVLDQVVRPVGGQLAFGAVGGGGALGGVLLLDEAGRLQVGLAPGHEVDALARGQRARQRRRGPVGAVDGLGRCLAVIPAGLGARVVFRRAGAERRDGDGGERQDQCGRRACAAHCGPRFPSGCSPPAAAGQSIAHPPSGRSTASRAGSPA